MIYYYPCRPYLFSIDHPKIAELDADDNYDAEIKKNGSRTVFWNTKDAAPKKFGDFVFWNRHKEIADYCPPPSVLDELSSLELPNNTHLDLELLHKKVKGIRNVFYIYDIYVLNGKIVTDTLDARRARLHDIFKGRTFEHLSIAQTYRHNFKALYTEVIKSEENEGLVIKNVKGKIVWNTKVSPDVSWQIKVRREASNYKF